jgi:hypothetical protein
MMMANDRFTKQEAQSVTEALEEIMKAFPKARVGNFIGHFNDLFLFLSAAKAAAPEAKNGEGA